MSNHSEKICCAFGTNQSVSGSTSAAYGIYSLIETFLAVMISLSLRPSYFMSVPFYLSSMIFLPGNSNSTYLGARPKILAISLLNSQRVQLVKTLTTKARSTRSSPHAFFWPMYLITILSRSSPLRIEQWGLIPTVPFCSLFWITALIIWVTRLIMCEDTLLSGLMSSKHLLSRIWRYA